jgi:hypothetical protein
VAALKMFLQVRIAHANIITKENPIKNRQDKKRQDNAQQEKARQYMTRQQKTSPDETINYRQTDKG